MQRWKGYLEELGSVTTFDYPYMREGKRRPDPLPKLIEAHREAIIEAMRGRRSPLVLIGKSMGSRVGCHVAAASDAVAERVRAVVCLGYPLKGMGKTQKLRDEVLLALTKPVLFVQGTRDNLCPPELLTKVRKKMHTRNELLLVEGGSHSLEVGKRQLALIGEKQEDVDRRGLSAIQGFLDDVLD
jgi:hypothetical protein